MSLTRYGSGASYSCCRAEEFVRRETVLCGAYTEKKVSHNGGRICVTSAVPAHMLVINVNLPHQGIVTWLFSKQVALGLSIIPVRPGAIGVGRE